MKYLKFSTDDACISVWSAGIFLYTPFLFIFGYPFVFRDHRHYVFTIPEELRSFFPKDHSPLNCLSHSVRDVILRMFFKLKGQSYKGHPEGFYVRAKPNLYPPDVTLKYISKCPGRPVVATSRIDTYDGDCMTFHYQRHEDHKTITECIPAIDLIERLIVYVPNRHFKMVCYYGIYAKHHKQEKNLRKCLSHQKRQYLSRLLDWRNSILLVFGYDPLRCPKYGISMLVLEIYHKKTVLFERYRKVMGYG